MASATAIIAAVWLLLTVFCGGVLVLWARRTRRFKAAPPPRAHQSPTWGIPGDSPDLLPLASRELDVARECAGALAALRALAAENLIELQLAVQPKLAIWADPYALRHALIELLTQAIERAAGGAVLLAAGWHGGRVQFSVTDDGDRQDHAALTALLRRVDPYIALQGGTLEVGYTSTQGNVVIARLPGVREPPSQMIEEPAVEEEHVVRDIRSLGVPRDA
jgi:hypothetical protein